MTLGLPCVKEIDSGTLEQQTCERLDEVYRLQIILKKLENKVKSLNEDENEDIGFYNENIAHLKAIVEAKIAAALCHDGSIHYEGCPEYQLVSSSKIQIGEHTLELSEDESDEPDGSPLPKCEFLRLRDVTAVKLGMGISMPIELYDKLYPHQKKGVRWLASLHGRKSGGILADDMGLGKTVTVLAFLNSLIFSLENGFIDLEGKLEVLVVAPITLINQWRDEMLKWAPKLKPFAFHSSMGAFTRTSLFANNGKQRRHIAVITSYETFRVNLEGFNVLHWSYVILDEGQKIRNPDSAITLAVKTLGTPHRLLLSGSPIQNNLVEFWSLLDFVAPGHLGTLPLFVEQFVDPIINARNHSNSSAAYNCALRLRSLILPFMQRNLKADFAKCIKLPKKTEHVLVCNLTSVQYYVYVGMLQSVLRLPSLKSFDLSTILTNSKGKLNSSVRSNRILYLLTMLRKICNHPDLVLKDYPNDFGNIERSSKLMIAQEIVEKWEVQGHKVLIFSQTVQMLDIIHSCMKQKFPDDRMCRLDGKVAFRKRDKILHSFQNDDGVFLLLLTTRVGGVGLNLTCADRILIFDPDWNPMTDSQARERSYRIGQNRDVVIYRLILAHTVEEKIYHRQIYKYFLSERILTDPRVVNYRFLPASDLLAIPPPPNDQKKMTHNKYIDNVQKQLMSLDFEAEIRKINNTRNVYKSNDDVKNMDNAEADNPLLQSIFANHEIQGVIKHDDIENSTLSSVNQTSSKIADAAVKILKRSQKERNAFDISVPTWTGKSGRAAAPVNVKKRLISTDDKQLSKNLLNNLKHLKDNAHKPKMRASQEEIIAGHIIEYFNKRIDFSSPTGDVVQFFAPLIPESQTNVFKLALKRLCQLIKVNHGPNYWKLRSEFCQLNHL